MDKDEGKSSPVKMSTIDGKPDQELEADVPNDEPQAQAGVSMSLTDGKPDQEMEAGLPNDVSKAGEEAQDGDIISIPEDSFSMFFVAVSWGEHVPPAIVFLVQIWILALIVKSMTGPDLAGSDVSLMVQVLGATVSVFSASDFVDGLLFVGRPVTMGGDPLARRGAKRSCKWEFSYLMRLSEGIFFVCVSFMFISQVRTERALMIRNPCLLMISLGLPLPRSLFPQEQRDRRSFPEFRRGGVRERAG